MQWFDTHDGFDGFDELKWGINFKAPTLPTVWDPNGLYYYVNKSHPNAVDTGEDPVYRGNPNLPRKRMPTGVPAGSVIVVTGGPYNVSDVVGAYVRVGGNGTMNQPVFVYGDALGTKTEINTSFRLEGTYVIAQGLHIRDIPPGNTSVEFSWRNSTSPCHHLILRDYEVTNPREIRPPSTGESSPDYYFAGNRSGIAIYGPTSSQNVHDIIVYKCNVHDMGAWKWDPTGSDHDEHGIGIGQFSADITVMQCTLYHCEGDGVQINSGCYEQRDKTKNILLYRNQSHDQKQSGLWVKFAHQVTFLENEVWGIAGSNSSADGPAMGGQYGPVDAHFIANKITKSKTGILIASRDGPGCGGNSPPTLPLPPPSPTTAGEGTGLVIEENEIRDAARGPADPAYVGFAVHLRAQGALHPMPAINYNTIFACDGGIGVSGGGVSQITPITALSNTFCNVPIAYYHIQFERCESRDQSTLAGNAVACPTGDPLRISPGCP